MPTTSVNTKRNVQPDGRYGRYAAGAVHHHGGHHHLHHRHGKGKDLEELRLSERAVGDLVTATIDGVLVSWTNIYAGPGVATAAPGAVDGSDTLISASDMIGDKSVTFQESTSPATTTSSSFSTTSKTISQATGESWTRQAYYNAASGIADGLTFLNHFGGTDGIPGTSDGGPALATLDQEGRRWIC